MKRFPWANIAKCLAAVCLIFTLLLSACTPIDTKQSPVTATADGKDEQPMRTAEIFDKKKYKDLLTIRYFYLPGDVAEGDSILIQTPDGKNMLIDAGSPEVGPKIVEYLDKLGVDEIHIALNTHPHSDHIGGFAAVINAKKVDQFYMEQMPYSSSAYTKTLAALRQKNVPIAFLEEGSTFDLGKDVHFEVLSPAKGALPKAFEERKKEKVGDSDAAIVNYFSIVTLMTYKNNKFIFGADSYKDREGELVQKFGSKLDVDFAHVNHHGWNTSSDFDWIKTLSPQYAVASNNIFSTLDVLKRYDAQKVKIFVTRFNGNVLITSDGNKLNAIPEKQTTTLPPGFLKNQ
jgi:beta-lactamase superfamily II metal-dependent hydrolase